MFSRLFRSPTPCTIRNGPQSKIATISAVETSSPLLYLFCCMLLSPSHSLCDHVCILFRRVLTSCSGNFSFVYLSLHPMVRTDGFMDPYPRPHSLGDLKEQLTFFSCVLLLVLVDPGKSSCHTRFQAAFESRAQSPRRLYQPTPDFMLPRFSCSGCMYVAFAVPFKLGFLDAHDTVNECPFSGDTSKLRITLSSFDVCTDLVFLSDLVLAFHTARWKISTGVTTAP